MAALTEDAPGTVSVGLWRASLWSGATSGWGRDRSGAESPTEGVSAVPTEGEFELGNVGTHFLPGTGRLKVTADDVVKALPHGSLAGVVPVVVRLAAYAAAQTHLAHHLQGRLIGNALPFLSAQAHGHLPVTTPVGGS